MNKIIFSVGILCLAASGKALAQTQNNMTPGDMVNQPVRTRIEDSLKEIRPGNDTMQQNTVNNTPANGGVITHFEDSAYLGKAPDGAGDTKHMKHNHEAEIPAKAPESKR